MQTASVPHATLAARGLVKLFSIKNPNSSLHHQIQSYPCTASNNFINRNNVYSLPISPCAHPILDRTPPHSFNLSASHHFSVSTIVLVTNVDCFTMLTKFFFILSYVIPTQMMCPLSLTLGSLRMNSCALASLAHSSISALVASGRPNRMFSSTVVANRTGSWLTTPIWVLSQPTLTSRMSFPSTNTCCRMGDNKCYYQCRLVTINFTCMLSNVINTKAYAFVLIKRITFLDTIAIPQNSNT